MSALEIIAKWGTVALFTFGTLATVRDVGKPRNTMTGGIAAGIVVINAAIITAIIVYWD